MQNKLLNTVTSQVGKVVRITSKQMLEKAGWSNVTRPIEETNFIPVVPDKMFALMAKMLMDGEGEEVSGNFYIDPSSHEIEYMSVARKDGNKHYRATLTADENAALLSGDRMAGYSPNGQWHTHPFGDAYWSTIDTEDQIRDVVLASAFNVSGERFFMCVGEYDVLVRRVRWHDDKVVYEDQNAFLENGRELSGHRKFTPFYSPTPIMAGSALASGTTISKKESILDYSPQMQGDMEFCNNLPPSERMRVYEMISDRYGDLYHITDVLKTATVTDAVNKVFATYGAQLGDEILRDKSSYKILSVLEGERNGKQV